VTVAVWVASVTVVALRMARVDEAKVLRDAE
jgi:hypothetical protein